MAHNFYLVSTSQHFFRIFIVAEEAEKQELEALEGLLAKAQKAREIQTKVCVECKLIHIQLKFNLLRLVFYSGTGLPGGVGGGHSRFQVMRRCEWRQIKTQKIPQA